jgi:pimeloyl-ACP methyl ester carboxylesterase
MLIRIIIAVTLGMWALLGAMLAAGEYLTRRRKPDAPDTPGNYGLPYEEVTFQSRYKTTLRGWWIPAEDPKGTVILCHGQNGSMDADTRQAVPLNHAGYNVLMFNFRAHGTSDGDKVTFGVFEKEDLLGAVDFLHEVKGIEQVAVMGFSMGAAVALIAAALTDKITVLVLDGMFWRFLDVIDRYLQKRLIPPPLSYVLAQMTVVGASVRTNTRMFQVSPRLWAKHLDPSIPVLFIHGERDFLVTERDVRNVAADLRGEYDIWIAPDSHHREAFDKHEAEYNRRVAAWLGQYLL